jgi:hypothetical protein
MIARAAGRNLALNLLQLSVPRPKQPFQLDKRIRPFTMPQFDHVQVRSTSPTKGLASKQKPKPKPKSKSKHKNRPPLYPLYFWRNIHAGSRLKFIRDVDHANAELSTLQQGPFGFDLEWKPNFSKGQAQNRVALVQLANENTILLLQISAMPSESRPTSKRSSGFLFIEPF